MRIWWKYHNTSRNWDFPVPIAYCSGFGIFKQNRDNPNEIGMVPLESLKQTGGFRNGFEFLAARSWVLGITKWRPKKSYELLAAAAILQYKVHFHIDKICENHHGKRRSTKKKISVFKARREAPKVKRIENQRWSNKRGAWRYSHWTKHLLVDPDRVPAGTGVYIL